MEGEGDGWRGMKRRTINIYANRAIKSACCWFGIACCSEQIWILRLMDWMEWMGMLTHALKMVYVSYRSMFCYLWISHIVSILILIHTYDMCTKAPLRSPFFIFSFCLYLFMCILQTTLPATWERKLRRKNVQTVDLIWRDARIKYCYYYYAVTWTSDWFERQEQQQRNQSN